MLHLPALLLPLDVALFLDAVEDAAEIRQPVGSTRVAHSMSSRVVRSILWYTTYSGSEPRPNSALVGCRCMAIDVLRLAYSPIPLTFAAWWKYAAQMHLRTVSQSVPQLTMGIF